MASLGYEKSAVFPIANLSVFRILENESRVAAVKTNKKVCMREERIEREAYIKQTGPH